MSQLKAPYLQLRLRRDDVTIARFAASPKLRRLNYKSFDLYTDGPPLDPQEAVSLGFAARDTEKLPFTHPGQPMSPGQAVKACNDLAKIIDLQINDEQPESHLKIMSHAKPMDINHLLDDFFETDEFLIMTKPKTQLGYKSWAKLIRTYFGEQRPKALDEVAIIDIYWAARKSRGERIAYGAIQILRIAYRWGRIRSRKWKYIVPIIEWNGLKIPKPAPRVRVGTDEELAAIILAADNPRKIFEMTGAPVNQQKPSTLMARPSMADALILALWTAQRQTDILLLTNQNIVRGRCSLKQRKGGSSVSIPFMPEAKTRIADLQRRKMKREWGDRPHIILTDANGMPYQSEAATNTTFSSYFCKTRNLAATICPSAKDFQFRDLRDTAITRLGDAGCDIWEIISWSGHNPDSAMSVIKHYMAIDASFADRAGEKLLKKIANRH